ncbi:MAG TPA: DUF58 domain-containing protein [Pseudobdellovibrionaceae bacterium]|nr:DUF58 domain-containing protein [Pseudobdellovibrionaceae bacterium]
MAQHQRLYIIPTRFGVYFLVASVLVILIGAAYQNNLVNILGFFMLALLFIAMIATHENLKGLRVTRVEPAAGFAGELLTFKVYVHNTTGAPKAGCRFAIREFPISIPSDPRAKIEAQAEARLQAGVRAPSRGLHKVHKIRLYTTAPFGLFYVWLWQTADTQITVYPRRFGDRNWQEAEIGHEASPHASRQPGAEDYSHHSLYQSGESLQRVDWKANARGRPLLTKHYDEARTSGVRLNYQNLVGLDHEQRLEQLSAWVDQATKSGRSFQITLPNGQLGPDRGLAFAQRAWTLLAEQEPPQEGRT